MNWDGARFTIADLGSSNGRFVDGQRLAPNAPVSLRPGDRVSFGGVVAWTVVWQ